MPRGNLEGIYPRMIMLKKSFELIQNIKYGEAFRLLRQHKIDINLIHDLDPDKFFENVDVLVRELKSVDYLNLFINSINESARGRELEFMLPLSDEDRIKNLHKEELD